MKNVLIAVAGIAVGLSASAVFAGSQCCPGSKKAAKADGVTVQTASAAAATEKQKCSMDCLADAGLSAEQMEQIKAFKAECDAKGGCSVESAEKMKAKLATILSAEQMEKLKASCAEKGCAMPEAKTDSASTEAVETAPAS